MKKAQMNLDQDRELLKTATKVPAASLQRVKSLLYPLLGTATIAGAAGLYGYMRSKEELEQHKKDLADSMGAIFSSAPQFKEDPKQFAALFGELSVISPTIAKNPQIGGQLLSSRMGQGFSLDDVHKLSVIEQASASRRNMATLPGAAARGAAFGALDRIVMAFGPKIWDYGMNIGSEAMRAAAQAKPKIEARNKMSEFSQAAKSAKTEEEQKKTVQNFLLEMTKQNSAVTPSSFEEVELRVSEETLGRMLSDRHTLLKQAGVMEAAREGGKKLVDHLAYIAPALALGGGMGLVKLVMDKANDAKLHAQADQSFQALMRKSDVLKQDPAVAREAFESLKLFAPALAARPQVLKTFVESQVNAAGFLPPDQVKLLAEAGGAAERARGGGGNFVSGMRGAMDVLKIPVMKKQKKDD